MTCEHWLLSYIRTYTCTCLQSYATWDNAFSFIFTWLWSFTCQKRRPRRSATGGFRQMLVVKLCVCSTVKSQALLLDDPSRWSPKFRIHAILYIPGCSRWVQLKLPCTSTLTNYCTLHFCSLYPEQLSSSWKGKQQRWRKIWNWLAQIRTAWRWVLLSGGHGSCSGLQPFLCTRFTIRPLDESSEVSSYNSQFCHYAIRITRREVHGLQFKKFYLYT